jgi:Zn-dependent protease with chaperone function
VNNYLHQFVTLSLSSHFSTLWPIFAVPLLAAALIRPTLSLIECLPPGSREQRRLAFLASIMPGVVFWCAALPSARVMSLSALHSPRCMAHCAVLIAMFAVVPLRATLPFIHQRTKLVRLLQFKQLPSPRLRRAAFGLGVPIWEIPIQDPVCCIVGIVKPQLLLSTGALRVLSDDELHAALLHERAHLNNRETLWASVAAFLNRASLFAVSSSLELFRNAGEYAADREASRDSNPASLASALLRFSRSGTIDESFAISFAAARNVVSRARLLICDEPASKAGLRTIVAAGLLLSTAAVSLLPWAVRLASDLWCR